MHKRVLFLSFTSLLFLLQTVSAQIIAKEDFEGNGTVNSWAGDGCDITVGLDNPFRDATNASNKVLEYFDKGGLYANVRFDVSNNLNVQKGPVFKLKIYVPASEITGKQNNQIALKLQDGNLAEPWSTQCEIIKPLKLDEWQEVSFDFVNDAYINLNANSLPPSQRTDFNRVVIQINGENNSDHVRAYIDDVEQIEGSEPEESEFTKLIWSDEFDGSGGINTDNWFAQTKLPNGDSWFNNEIQHYTDRVDNASVADGKLSITAKKETYTSQDVTKDYTSARLNSKFAFTYGRVEVRAKLPSGSGTWPAIWMLGKNISETGTYWDNEGFGTTPWPQCGEIDIMEHWGDNPNFIQSAMHTPSSFGGTVNKGGQVLPTATTAFHTYSLDWYEDKMVFAVDDKVHYTYKPDVYNEQTWPFDKDQFILLNVAIQSSISTSFTSSAMEIDYVRVYQRDESASLTTSAQPKLLHYPNPIHNNLTVRLPKTPNQGVQVHMYAVDGRDVTPQQIRFEENNLVLSELGFLPSGVYYLTISQNGVHHNLKVLKN
jgi:beta-glucanase (GH16 family)